MNLTSRYVAAVAVGGALACGTCAVCDGAITPHGSGAAATPVGFSSLGTVLPPAADAVPIPDGFTEQAPDTHTTMPPLTPAQIARGYVTYTGSPMDFVYPSTAPRAGQIGTTIDLSSARNEYEPATFSIRALQNMSGVNVVLNGDLVGPGGATIDASHVDIRSARTMPRRVWAQPRYVLMPSALERRPDLSIGADTSQQFWVTVKAPKGARPGTYHGTLDLQVSGLSNTTLDVNLEVLPFDLDPTPTAHGMYYTLVDLENGSATQALPAARIRQDVGNMAAHGMNTLFVSIPPPFDLVSVQHDGQPRWQFDLTPLMPLIDAYEEHGFGAPVFNTTISELLETPIGYASAVEALVNSFTANGSLAPILSTGDEGDANGSLGTVRSWLEQINSTVPDERTFTTIVFPENADVYEDQDLDIRALSSYIDQRAIASTAAAGRELWMYSGAAGYGVDPIGDRLYRGIWSRVFDLDGALQWTYFRPALDPTQPYQDLFSESHRNNMTLWVLPGLDGPIPSLGWEAMREGVEDERYFLTLQRLIDEAMASGDPDMEALALSASRFLAETLAVIDTGPRPDDSVFTIRREAAKLDAAFFEAFRRQAAEHIVALIPEPSGLALLVPCGAAIWSRRQRRA